MNEEGTWFLTDVTKVEKTYITTGPGKTGKNYFKITYGVPEIPGYMPTMPIGSEYWTKGCTYGLGIDYLQIKGLSEEQIKVYKVDVVTTSNYKVMPEGTNGINPNYQKNQ